MKNINNYLLGVLGAIALLVSSCNTDNEGTIYNPDTVGASFYWPKNTITVVPGQTAFEVTIARDNILSEATVNIASLTEFTQFFNLPSTVTFAAGQGTAQFKVTTDVPNMAFGGSYPVTLTIGDGQVSAGGNKTTALTIVKDYDWRDIGTGQYFDNWALAKTYDVKMVKAEGFERYRALEPYHKGMEEDAGDWGNWITSPPAYVEFYMPTGGLTAGNLVKFNTFAYGLAYQADRTKPISGYYPPTYNSTLSGAYNKVIDAKTIQLAPYIYALGVGGWNYSQTNGVILITLP